MKNEHVLTESGQECLRSLLAVWFEFDLALSRIPIVQRLEQERLSLKDYQQILCHLRQQVIEGSRWITRCASSFDRDHSELRSVVIHHAKDEHRDFELLEKDFEASGGELSVIRNMDKNIGSEALHGFLMYRASLPNPVDLIGAMWIVEGLGNKMATKWATLVDKQFDSAKPINLFMKYHGENDESHMQELYQLIDQVATDQRAIARIVKTASVVAKLYCLQLEEVDNDK